MKARLGVLLALTLAVLALGLAASGAAPAPSGATRPREFSYSGAGTNRVNIQTGELREFWKGHVKPFGKITAHVAGWVTFPTSSSLIVHSSMVIVDRHGDVLIGACKGAGSIPAPDGAEDWTCDATGGIGKFKGSRGQWTLHIDIHRVSIKDGVQENRFTEAGAGKITWHRQSSTPR